MNTKEGGVFILIQYHENGDLAEVDGFFFRRDKRTGYYLSGKPINGKRRRLHVYVWEKANGEIPNGYEVHHRDMDKSNNELDNLVLVLGIKHQRFHGVLRAINDTNWADDFQAKGIEAAKEWHRSTEGRQWHKEHYEKTKDALYAKHEEVCSFCGKRFLTPVYRKNSFCSNKCKAAFRRASGVDDEERRCPICGGTFKISKYSRQRTCSRRCGHILQHQTRSDKKNNN